MSASFAPVGYRLQWQDFSNWQANRPVPAIQWKDYETLEEAQDGKAELRRSAAPNSQLVACINPIPSPETGINGDLLKQKKHRPARGRR